MHTRRAPEGIHGNLVSRNYLNVGVYNILMCVRWIVCEVCEGPALPVYDKYSLREFV
jgi:hypothetical protein